MTNLKIILYKIYRKGYKKYLDIIFSLAYSFQIIIYKICSKVCKTDVVEIYSNGYKTDILDNYVLLAILCCMLVISLQLAPIIFFYCEYTLKYIKRYIKQLTSVIFFYCKYTLKYIKGYTKFKKIKNLKFPRLASIRLGYYYANKVDNTYFASLISKIIKKHLNLKKKITKEEIIKDLYYSTWYGPLYYYRKIQGFINRSILFSLIKRITWISSFLIFLNRTDNLRINLGMYLVS